jgi:hypothetical protein
MVVMRSEFQPFGATQLVRRTRANEFAHWSRIVAMMCVMSDPIAVPEPHDIPGGLDSKLDLEVGADDGPDIVEGVPEDEPDLSTLRLRETPFRTPHAGERLSEEQLERDVEWS